MAKITITVPDDRVALWLEAFRPTLLGVPATGAGGKYQLADIGVYYEQQATAVVRAFETARMHAAIDDGLPADVHAPLVIDEVVAEHKRRQADREAEARAKR